MSAPALRLNLLANSNIQVNSLRALRLCESINTYLPSQPGFYNVMPINRDRVDT